MAKVSLRVYNREIESMVEAGQLDEAIAHCQHILKTFPMHVETYLLLGKAFLEARRYTDAADIFQRVLMSVPDNFVSHVGMSIIRDDESKLDDAIWHMERAFEVQPSNPAIQGELRRLYGRRDGIEPPKIRLSRDALANMYAQGELFNQAIAEIRAVLTDDDNRPDLQVMLARAYYRGGRKVEAVEMAANLLKKYTYCMDALRILVDVLPGTARAEDTQVYRQRLRMLDPYTSFVTGSVFGTDKVEDGAVNMERLEYRPGAAPVSPQPGWASSLGIQLESEKTAEPVPDWMTSGSTPEQPPAAEPGPGVQAETPAPVEESVPEWMRSAGWHEPDQAGQAGTEQPVSEDAAEPISQADMPDWLKAMAPQDQQQAPDFAAGVVPEGPAAEPSTGDEIPDWLSDLKPVVASSAPETPPAEAPTPENAFPDWLTGGSTPEPGTSTDSGINPLPGAAANEIPEGDLPSFLEPVEDVPGIEAPSAKAASVQPDEKLPEFLSETHPADVPPESVEPESKPEQLEQTKPFGAGAKTGEDVPFQPTGEVKPLNIEDDAMAWLESLAVKQGAKEEELLSRPQDRSEEMPDSVQQAGELPHDSILGTPQPGIEAGAPSGAEAPVLGVEGVFSPEPGEMAPTPEAMDGLPAAAPAEDIPAWLRELKEESTSASEEIPGPETLLPVEASTEPVVQPASPAEDIPAWLRELKEESPEVTAGLAQEAASYPVENPFEEAVQPAAPAGDIPDWLTQMKDESPAVPEGLPPSPDVPVDNPPAWLETPIQAPDISPGTPPPAIPEEKIETIARAESGQVEPVIPLSEEENDITITSWLSKMDVEEALKKGQAAPAAEQPPQAPAEPLPDWLKDLDKQPSRVDDIPPVPEPFAVPDDLPDWLSKPVQAVEQEPASPSTKESLQPAAEQPVEPVAEEPVQPAAQELVPPKAEQPEPLIVPGSLPEEALAAWGDEGAPVSEPPSPTVPGEWVSAEEKQAPPPETPQESVPGPGVVPPGSLAQPAAVKHTGMLSRVPVDKDSDILMAAQADLDANRLNEAIKRYTTLIRKGRLLDEVIHDLHEALYRFPVDVIVWQTLGDASMRANRLQDALDAYTKAEELLR